MSLKICQSSANCCPARRAGRCQLGSVFVRAGPHDLELFLRASSLLFSILAQPAFSPSLQAVGGPGPPARSSYSPSASWRRICWPVSGGAPAYSRCPSSASFWHGAGPTQTNREADVPQAVAELADAKGPCTRRAFDCEYMDALGLASDRHPPPSPIRD